MYSPTLLPKVGARREEAGPLAALGAPFELRERPVCCTTGDWGALCWLDGERFVVLFAM